MQRQTNNGGGKIVTELFRPIGKIGKRQILLFVKKEPKSRRKKGIVYHRAQIKERDELLFSARGRGELREKRFVLF